MIFKIASVVYFGIACTLANGLDTTGQALLSPSSESTSVAVLINTGSGSDERSGTRA